MSKDLIPEIEYCAFNLAIFLFCFTEVIDDYTSIFKLNHEFSFQDFIGLILINDDSIPSINKLALLHALFIFKGIFAKNYSDIF